MSAHTKGEWVVVVEPERPDEPAIMVDEWYVATCHDNANDGDTLANARLIAAAPSCTPSPMISKFPALMQTALYG